MSNRDFRIVETPPEAFRRFTGDSTFSRFSHLKCCCESHRESCPRIVSETPTLNTTNTPNGFPVFHNTNDRAVLLMIITEDNSIIVTYTTTWVGVQLPHGGNYKILIYCSVLRGRSNRLIIKSCKKSLITPQPPSASASPFSLSRPSRYIPITSFDHFQFSCDSLSCHPNSVRLIDL